MRQPDENEPIARMAVEVDGGDPTKNVEALVTVCKQMCEALDKSPAEGALLLMTAAAFILDTEAIGMAEDRGDEPDYARIIGAYMQMAANGWNMNAMMFRGVTKPELGGMTMMGDLDEDEDKGPTLQ